MSYSARSTPGRMIDRTQVRATAGAICAAVIFAVAGCSSGSGSVDNTGTTAATPTTDSLAPSFTAPAQSSIVGDTAIAGSPGSAASNPAMGGPATSGSSSYSADRQRLCQARDDLRASVSQLTDPSLLGQGASAIGNAVDNVQTNLNSLNTAAQPELKPQLDAMQAAVQQLRTSAGNVGSGNIAQNLQNLAGDVAAVGSAAADLFRALDAACGS